MLRRGKCFSLKVRSSRTHSLSGHNDKPEENDRDGDKRRRYHTNNVELHFERSRHRELSRDGCRPVERGQPRSVMLW